jgi:hypothetical protein
MVALTRVQLLERLVAAGGSGTDEDVAAVRSEIGRLSTDVLAFLHRKRVKVVACRGSVTDFETSLRGKLPRGWDPNKGITWDHVPGAYLIRRKRVVVATVAAGGGRAVPPKGQGHGSINLALHEAMHGHDIAGGHRLTSSAGFRAARAADLPRLPAYEAQPGAAGVEETYAESAARHFSDDPGLAGDWPALAAWWARDPAGEGLEASFSLERHGATEEHGADAPIGTVSRQDDGSLFYDLRADEPEVAVGHAAFVEPAPEAGRESMALSGSGIRLVMPYR